MGKRTFQTIFFMASLGLSAFVNLFTGDSNVQEFYKSNTTTILVISVILTLLCIIFTYNSETKEAKEANAELDSGRFAWSIFSNGILGVAGGMLLGFALLWVYTYLSKNPNFSLLQAVDSNKVIPILIGSIFGYSFKTIDDNIPAGILIGSFIGLVLSYYIPDTLQVNVFSMFVVGKAIISASIAAGFIELFAAIFKPSTIRREERKKKKMLDEISRYEHCAASLRQIGYGMYSNSTGDNIRKFVIRNAILYVEEQERETGKKLERPEEGSLHSILMDGENLMKSHPIYLYYKLFFESEEKNPATLKPPFSIFDRFGKEIQSFNSLEALYARVNNLIVEIPKLTSG